MIIEIQNANLKILLQLYCIAILKKCPCSNFDNNLATVSKDDPDDPKLRIWILKNDH